MRWRFQVRNLIGLLLVLLAACGPARTVPPADSQPELTRTSISVGLPTQNSYPLTTPDLQSPSPSPVPQTAAPVDRPSPTASPQPSSSPTLEDPALPQTPVSLSASWRQPWQFFSSASVSSGQVLYRFRYPLGWHIYPQPGDGLILQNFAGSSLPTSDLRSGMIRVEMHAEFADTIGGFPAPALQPLAAGKPGTRRVRVDSALNVITWDVRLYGISRESAMFRLTGTLRGSPAQAGSGVELLDAILATLDLYGMPDPTPIPVIPDPGMIGGWDAYSGLLKTDASSFLVRFRFPHGWWAYPEEQQRIVLTNLFSEDPQKRAYALGEVQLTVSASPCDQEVGCPKGLPMAGGGLQGKREISQPAECGTQCSETHWLVNLYKDHTRFTFSAQLSGSTDEVENGIKVLDRILWALEIEKQ